MEATRLEGLSNEEKRAVLYKEKLDSLMLAAFAYEKEGNQTKADETWALWTAARGKIKTLYP